jgi:carbonic anhydrase
LHSHSVNYHTSQNTTNFEHHYFRKTEQPHTAEWGYEGDIGPKHWGSLSPAYILAKQGEQQSPIDISKPIEKDLPRVVFNYRLSKINLVYNGYTIEEEEGGSHIRFKEELFELKQFHLHASSEHTINGKHADMEMHLVHKAKDGTVAVIAVMIEQGAENRSFTSIWENLSTPEKTKVRVARTVDATDLLPLNYAYYRYRGSFTTPPCTEGVIWIVLAAPNELSPRQIDKFKSIINNI